MNIEFKAMNKFLSKKKKFIQISYWGGLASLHCFIHSIFNIKELQTHHRLTAYNLILHTLYNASYSAATTEWKTK
jgi:hypothetical protein